MLAAAHLWMQQRYAVDVPSLDDFTQLLAVPGYVEYTDGLWNKLAFLFSGTPDHRIFTLRAIAWAQSHLPGGLDFRKLLFFGNALCIAATLLVLRQAPAAVRWWLAPVFALVIFSPAHWESQYWPTGALSHLAVLFYALAALYYAREAAWPSTVVAVALALCSALTVANGLLVFPAAAVETWLLGRRRAAGAWLVAGAALSAAYCIGFPAGRAPIVAELAHPVQLATAFFAALGSLADLGTGLVPCILLGIGLGVLALLLLLPVQRPQVSPLLVSWLAFIVGSDAMIALGRSSFGMEALVLSRYRIYSAFAALVILVLYVSRQGRRVTAWPGAVVAAAVLAWAVVAWHANLMPLTLFAVERRVGLDHYLASGRGMYLDFPAQAFGDFLLQRARERGDFEPEPRAHRAVSLREVHGQHPALEPFFAALAEPFVQGTTVSVYGRTSKAVPAVFAYLESATREYRGETTQQAVPDPFPGDWQVMFWGTYPLAGIAPGRYRLGYAIDDAPGAAVFWTDRWIAVPSCPGSPACTASVASIAMGSVHRAGAGRRLPPDDHA